MKFDVVIGNPPYQDSSNAATNNKLWMKFVSLSFDRCAEGGVISLVTPDSVVGQTLQPAKIRKRLSTDFSLNLLDYTAHDFFNVGVNICRWSAIRTPYMGTTRVVEHGAERVIDLRKELPLKFAKTAVNNLAEKIATVVKDENTKKLAGHFECPIKVDDGDTMVFWSGPNKRRSVNFTPSNAGQLKLAVSYSASVHKWFVTDSPVSGWNKIFPVKTVEEGLKIGETFSQPVLQFFMANWRKTAGFTPVIRQKDMVPDLRGMTDDEVNKLFGLTAEEIELIYSNHKASKLETRVLSLNL